MTYKNFALDHFLEACLEFIPKDNIVRIGKAGSEKLSEVNLRNVSWIISLYTYGVELLLEKSPRIIFHTFVLMSSKHNMVPEFFLTFSYIYSYFKKGCLSKT